MSEMRLKSMEIKREDWGENKGKFIGSIRYTGEHANIDLKLNDEQIQSIFAIVADRMIEVSKEAAKELTCDIIESLTQRIEES